MLVYFLYLDKNPGWVIDDNVYEEFLRIIRLVVNQLTVPVLDLPRESYFLLFSVVLCKTMLWY